MVNAHSFRFFERIFAVRMVVAILLSAILLIPQVSLAHDDVSQELEAGSSWLVEQQAADGGFVGFSGASDPGATSDAVVALIAAGYTPGSIEVTKATDYLVANQDAFAATGPGSIAKLVLAFAAAGFDSSSDPQAALIVQLQAAAAAVPVGNGPYDAALVTLALEGVGAEAPASLIEGLVAAQGDDGSFAFDGSTAQGAGDSNTTAIVVQALAAGDLAGDEVELALGYLGSLASADGYPYQPGAEADANSTALVTQALIAVGSDREEDARLALMTFQNPSGAFVYMLSAPDDNLFATLQALPALAGLASPVLPVPVMATPLASPASSPIAA